VHTLSRTDRKGYTLRTRRDSEYSHGGL
jgi:hypothetical protein